MKILIYILKQWLKQTQKFFKLELFRIQFNNLVFQIRRLLFSNLRAQDVLYCTVQSIENLLN